MSIGNPPGALTKSNGSSISTFYASTLGPALAPAFVITSASALALVVTLISGPAPAVPSTNDELFKQFMKAYLEAQTQLPTLA